MIAGGRSLLALLVACAGVAVLVTIAATRGASPRLAPPPGDPLSYTATVEPSRILFGDRAVAELRMTIDQTRLDPGQVKVVPVFMPFRRVGPAVTDMVDLGDTTIVTVRYPIQCIDRACVSGNAGKEFDLPIGVLQYAPRQGDIVTLPLSFQSVFVASRLSSGVQEAIANSPGSLQLDLGIQPLPRPEFSTEPSLLGWLLVGAASAIVLALGAALAWRLRPRRGAAGIAEETALPPFEAALHAVEEALAGSQEDRRVALDALARQLDDLDSGELPQEARRLAWSQRGPDPGRARAVLEDARALAGPALEARR